MVFDEYCQLITATFMDNTMPRTDIETEAGIAGDPALSTHNSVGVRGRGKTLAAGFPAAATKTEATEISH